MQIIPAIDIIEGKCVRLIKGDYSQKTIYNEKPLEVAKQFEDAGLKRLHLVDLDGARAGEVKNWKVLERIALKTSLAVDFSGGISSQKNVQIAFDSGAAFASIGSIAVKDETALTGWLQIFGTEKFIIGADVKEELIVIKGWTETTTLSVFDLIKKYEVKGINQFFCTDVSKDGLLQGSSIELYKKIIKQFPFIHLIASGGVSSMDEIEKLEEAGCKGVIIGKAIYENKILLTDLKKLVQ
ncbi:MAG TPA: 1-(5-phosphoribosyl)-5-[(5-phosphoribosylamino)methylideneamino]imidazole-4-carboxamide isomerase [Chitinophagaceae bacterium]|nr:1-(5-phosphoribosyl)-5-[(5-phosphoribosylamino)methylideneamino]imidazole-4-carboxamide isomerase [Chitinophagaceae bacterium]